jgi:hypothetical protein
MATKADFNAEEWSRIVEAPALAALRVIAADRGGTFRESLSLARAYGEARQQGGSQLMEELVSSAPQIEPAQLRGPDELREHAAGRLQEALRTVEEKGTAEEFEDYKRFIANVAETVARAHKEGGVLGIGGKEVSESEQAVLDDLAGALGGPPGSRA